MMLIYDTFQQCILCIAMTKLNLNHQSTLIKHLNQHYNSKGKIPKWVKGIEVIVYQKLIIRNSVYYNVDEEYKIECN